MAHRRDQVTFVHRHRREPVLEQMAGPTPARIDEVGVTSMDLAHGAARAESLGR